MFRKKVSGIILGGAMMIGSCSASYGDFVGWLDSQGISQPYSVSSISAIADIFSSDAAPVPASVEDNPAVRFINACVSEIQSPNTKIATLWFFKYYFSYFAQEVDSRCSSLIFPALGDKTPNNIDIANSILTTGYARDHDTIKILASLFI